MPSSIEILTSSLFLRLSYVHETTKNTAGWPTSCKLYFTIFLNNNFLVVSYISMILVTDMANRTFKGYPATLLNESYYHHSEHTPRFRWIIKRFGLYDFSVVPRALRNPQKYSVRKIASDSSFALNSVISKPLNSGKYGVRSQFIR